MIPWKKRYERSKFKQSSIVWIKEWWFWLVLKSAKIDWEYKYRIWNTVYNEDSLYSPGKDKINKLFSLTSN